MRSSSGVMGFRVNRFSAGLKASGMPSGLSVCEKSSQSMMEIPESGNISGAADAGARAPHPVVRRRPFNPSITPSFPLVLDIAIKPNAYSSTAFRAPRPVVNWNA